MEEDRSWGKRIKAFRKLKRYTQEELANALHVSVSVIGAVERGNKIPSTKLLEDIARQLHINVLDIKGERSEGI